MKNIIIALISLSVFASCTESTPQKELAKFEPEDGKVILFAGQDLGAVGGLESYDDGYFDHFETPGGWTMYTNIRPGDTSFGNTYKGLDGMKTTDTWGSGYCNMQLQIDDADFHNSALAIGLELVNHDSLVAVGAHDDMIVELAQWVKSLGERPVFLRIGYEFDGFEWNFYTPEHYIPAYRRVKDIFDEQGVENYVAVWQSKGWGLNEEELMEFYPGDEYVDWCGYSHFSRGVEGGQAMINVARQLGKPLFIAEATPMIAKGDSSSYDVFLNVPEQADRAWEVYYKPLFKVIDDNPDVVKAISYINVDWYKQPMWEESDAFGNVDSRLHLSPLVSDNWKKITSQKKYLKASDELFDCLWGK